MSALTLIPVDNAARATGFHLLVADPEGPARAQFCGRWNPVSQRWEYGSGAPIEAEITHYAARTTVPA